MPRFQIIPTDRPDEIIEIEGVDAGSALHIANQLSCDQADVHRNGAYLFSVRTLGEACADAALLTMVLRAIRASAA